MDLSLFQNCPSLSSVLLDCLCCFHLISNFRNFSKEHIFCGVGLSAPCPTPNLENQGIPYCLVYHLWPCWHGRPCQKLCYHQHSSRVHLITQVPPQCQSRNTFRGITLTPLFHISGKQNVRLFRETWHPTDTPADGSLPQRIPWATAGSMSLQPWCLLYKSTACCLSLEVTQWMVQAVWEMVLCWPVLRGQCILAFAAVWMFQRDPQSCCVLLWWWWWWWWWLCQDPWVLNH